MNMFSEAVIRRVSHEIEKLHAQVHATFALRGRGPAERQAWEGACRAFHSYNHDLLLLWSPEVLRQIQDQSGEWRNTALNFLEVDPWFFRAGYLKEKLCQALKRAQLTHREAERIRGILLSVLKSRFRREYRSYCRLAGSVYNDQFLNELKTLTDGDDIKVQIRARWMLTQITQYQQMHPDRTAVVKTKI